MTSPGTMARRTGGPLPEGSSVVVIGAVNVDIEARALTDVTMGASNKASLIKQAGGVAGNVSRYLAEHLDTTLITAVGDDTQGQQLLAVFDSLGVTTLSETIVGATGHYLAVLDKQRNLLLGMADSSPTQSMSPVTILNHLQTVPASATMVVDANLPALTLQHLVGNLDFRPRASSGPLLAMAVSPEKVLRWRGLEDRVDLLIGNRAEFAALAAIDPGSTATEIAASVLATGFREVVMTDADRAITHGVDGNIIQIPTAVSNVDSAAGMVHSVNGAGDALAAGITRGLAQGLDTVRSIDLFGLPAAGQVISGRRRAPLL